MSEWQNVFTFCLANVSPPRCRRRALKVPLSSFSTRVSNVECTVRHRRKAKPSTRTTTPGGILLHRSHQRETLRQHSPLAEGLPRRVARSVPRSFLF